MHKNQIKFERKQFCSCNYLSGMFRFDKSIIIPYKSLSLLYQMRHILHDTANTRFENKEVKVVAF